MSYDLNGASVYSATVLRPRIGRWTADIELAADPISLDGPQTLTLGSLVLTGSVARGGDWVGTRYVRLVGGTGGLSATASPRAYRNVPLSFVLSELLTEIGEAPSPKSDPLASTVGQWVRLAGPASDALTELATAAGMSWRVLADGTVWIGTDTYPAFTSTSTLLAELPDEGRSIYGETEPTIGPGVTIDSRRTDYVEHHIKASEIRSLVWWAQ